MNDASTWQCPKDQTIGGMAELIMRDLTRPHTYAGLDQSMPNQESAARGRANASRSARSGRYRRAING